MGEEFACPHCGKNLGPSPSLTNATLMCPYCQQFFTMEGGVESAPAKEISRESGPVAAKPSVEAPAVDLPKPGPGDMPASAEPPVFARNVAGESDTLKAIAPEDRTKETFGPGADVIASNGREPAEAEKISAPAAFISRPADESAISPYVIPQLPRKTKSSILGISIMIIGLLGFAASLFLVGILTGNYGDYNLIKDNFQFVIERVENLQTTLHGKIGIAFIMTFGFQMVIAGGLVLISLGLLWAGEGIRYKKKSSWIVLIILIALVSAAGFQAVVMSNLSIQPEQTDNLSEPTVNLIDPNGVSEPNRVPY